MAHLSLSVFHISPGHLQPYRVGSSEASPMNPVEPQLPSRWLYESSQNVVVTNWLTVFDRLKHQVIGSVRFHCTILPHGPPGSDSDRQDLKPVYSLNNASVYRNSGIGTVTFRC